MVAKHSELGFDVFVSYSTVDKLVADAVVAAHEQAGIRCWYAPRDIPPGADWAESITKAIHDTAMMVLVFSNNSNRSQRVQDEINYAISETKPILPFRIEAIEPSGALRLHLSSRHWLDAYDPTWEAHIDSLVISVSAILAAAPEQEHGEDRSAPVSTIPVKGAKVQKPRGKLGYALGAIAVLAIVGVILWNVWGKNQPGAVESSPAETQTVAASTVTPTGEISEVLPTEPAPLTAVLHGALLEEEFSLDPQGHIFFTASATLIENMFLHLTEYDVQNATVVPEAAESWTISPDGRFYTFKLRPDIPWVTHSIGGETVQVLDEAGEPRYVTAYEFEVAIKRMCDPLINQYWIPPLSIKGCRGVFEHEDPENIPADLMDDIGVQAISDTELIFELDHPSGYFLTTTIGGGLSALPVWAMEKYGEAWNNPGLIPTNGAYVIDEWVPGESIRLVRNALYPEALRGAGNVQTVELLITTDENEAYELWETNQIDYAAIPADDLSYHLEQFPDETAQVYQQIVYYFSFQSNQPPFDNVHVRRAFSAAFDRAAFLDETFQGLGIPMKHLAPPGVFGAPPVDEVGVGYDLEYARSELEMAGYPQCQGLPPLEFFAYSSSAELSPETIRSWEKNLECPPGTIHFTARTDDVSASDVEWDIMGTGWASDFPDEENWLGSILQCENDSPFLDRDCDEVDNLLIQAREETASADRIALYRQIEEAFFGYDGTYPIAPIFSKIQYAANHTWLTRVPSVFGFERYYDWSVDMDAKGAARGE
jgi:oligopeptide transport system substrate-binding protein